MKADRKRLKAEKLDLLNQMKQLYCTLEDKESELREFIRTYEQKMKETEANIKQVNTVILLHIVTHTHIISPYIGSIFWFLCYPNEGCPNRVVKTKGLDCQVGYGLLAISP